MKNDKIFDEVMQMTEDELNNRIRMTLGFSPLLGGVGLQFTSDLNLMFDVEHMLLIGDEWGMYTDNIMDILVKNEGYQASELFVHASAKTRARAYVMTIEQMKEINK